MRISAIRARRRPSPRGLKSWRAAAKIAAHPHLYLGEAYMDGELTMEQGSIFDLLDLLGRNLALRQAPPNILGAWRSRL